MTKSLLGCHWIRTHPDNHDLAHIEAMQYKSVKLFEWHWNNRDACHDLIAVLPHDSYLIARDHPMSEQKQEMYRDPIKTGRRHADDWAEKVQWGRCFLPTDRTFFLGINEPDATTGDRHAIDRYTATFLNRLREHGLRGGAFNFSTGHPRTVDGTGNTAPDYSVFEESHQAIVHGHHIAVAHIYGSSTQPCVPGHFDRLQSCTWQDVEWIIGEMGSDEHVTSGGNHDGYLRTMNPPDYCPWLDKLIMGINDSRIHSYQVFTYDFSHPWDSFDVRPIRDALETYDWHHVSAPPTKPPTKPELPPTTPKPPTDATKLVHPLSGARITQHFYQNPNNYAQFNLPGHNGTDFGAPEGSPVLSMAFGIVAYSGFDEKYGFYVRIAHDALDCYSFVAHLKEAGLMAGSVVQAGDKIGLVGNTGNSTGPHLHFEIRQQNVDGTYKPGTPMPKGRCDPQTWCSLHGLKL